MLRMHLAFEMSTCSVKWFGGRNPCYLLLQDEIVGADANYLAQSD